MAFILHTTFARCTRHVVPETLEIQDAEPKVSVTFRHRTIGG